MKKIFYSCRLILGLLLLLGTSPTWGQTFDLTSLEPAVGDIPNGATIEWHNAVPTGAPPSMGTILADPTMATPGLYYAVYNLNGACFSEPSPVSILTTSCPTGGANLTSAVATADLPFGNTISYHSATPPTAANLFNGDPADAPVGDYFVAYYDSGRDCYSEATLIKVISQDCEICDNGLDDDGDGFIDCSDTDCVGSCIPVMDCTATGTDLPFTVSGSTQPGSTDEYVLTDMSNIVVQIASNSPFTGISPGDYIVYQVNYETADPISGLMVGQPISAITGGCFLVSAGMVAKVCDLVVTCDAGTNAPNLSSTTSMTTCPEGTAGISGVTADNNPGGLAFQWHSAANPTDNTTLLADVTMLTPGTYYAVFFDATDGGCYSPSASFIVTLMDCCMAGNAAPTYDASVPTVFCDAISQDLDEYTTDTPPSGTVLTWSTNSDPLVTADHLASSVVTTAGTYYGFFYDATNTCASPTLQVALSLTTSPDAGMDGVTTTCSDMNNGTTTVDLDDALGGTPDGSGSWMTTTDPSSGSVSIGAGNVVDFDGLADGTYVFTYTVTAMAPCTDATATVTVGVTACDGGCVATIRQIIITPNN